MSVCMLVANHMYHFAPGAVNHIPTSAAFVAMFLSVSKHFIYICVPSCCG